MKPKFVTDMCQVGTLRLYDANDFQRLLQRKMGDMGRVLKGIDHQNPAAIYFLQLLWRNIISIGDIGEIINPIAEHGELMMHDPNGMNHYTFYLKTSVFNDTCFHHWDSRITTGSKYVGKFHPDLVQNGGLPINRHVCILQKIKRPDIVQSCRMVFMLVGIDDGIQIFDPLPKHLLPEVRASVYDQAFGAYLKVDGAPQAFIPEIQRATYLTVTAYDR